jgi:cytochrome bd-type quinol oxidase subunit 2
MIQTIKKFITNGIVALALAVPMLAPASVLAADEIQSGLCAGVNLDVRDSSNCNPNSGDAEGRVNGLIKLIINIFSLVVGVVAVIMIIIGGLKYITSSGDSNNITSAKNTILYAIIGLIVVALAQFIVKFVLSKATGAGE